MGDEIRLIEKPDTYIDGPTTFFLGLHLAFDFALHFALAARAPEDPAAAAVPVTWPRLRAAQGRTANTTARSDL